MIVLFLVGVPAAIAAAIALSWLASRACPGCGRPSSGPCGFCETMRSRIPSLDARLSAKGY